MREDFVLFLYGMLALTGCFLSVFWGSKIHRRWNELESWKDLRVDRVIWLSAAMTAYALGMVFVGTTRSVGNLAYGLSPIAKGPGGYPLILGLIFFLLAQTLCVWLGDLDRRSPIWLWGMGLVAVIWTVVIIFIH